MHTFVIDGFGHDLRVIRFEGHEGLSQPFQFEVVVACAAGDVVFDDVVGKPAVLTFRVGDEPRYVHGIVASFEQGEDGKKLTTYRAVLVPAVWRLQHRRDSRIFQELAVPDILKKVLVAAGVPSSAYHFSLSGSYAPREYCVQYRESDWDFLCRLMEEEGIAYHFDHTSAGHVLTFADSPSAYAPITGDATLLFRPPSGALVMSEHVSKFRYAQRVRPGKVTLRDYNFKKPGLLLEGSDQAALDGDLEIYDQPGDYDAPGPGTALAKIRLEELQASRKTADGESACPRFIPGATFTLADHPRDDFNHDFLLTRVDHHGHEPGMEQSDDSAPYGNRFQVIPSEVAFRPAHITPRPAIKGVQTAIVSGPGGEEIYTDEHGRVKVQFHWDRQGKKNDKSSCWIRVSQLWAGAGWGAMWIPRIGQEVVVDFIEGDPDRPIIVGRVYHGANVPPYPLPAERTKSTIKSNSSPGGGGSNELRFEDKAGSEEIYLHGQKDYSIRIEHDKAQDIGHDESLHVGHDRSKTVDNDQSESIGGNKTIEVAKDHNETIHQNETITVNGNEMVTINKSRTHTVIMNDMESVGISQTSSIGASWNKSVGGAMTLSVSLKKSESVGGTSTESVSSDKVVSVGGSSDESVAKDKSVSVTKKMTLTVSEDLLENIKKNRKADIGESLQVHCGDVTITIKKDGSITVEGKDIKVKSTGTVKVEAKKLQVKTDGAVDVKASGNVTVKGGQVKMN